MTTIEKARELGMALATSPEYTRMQVAKQQMMENAELTALIAEYNGKQECLVDLMESGEMDSKEPAVMLTNDIEAIQKQLESNPLFTELLEAQQEFSNLIGAVNKEINACIGTPDEQETATASCGGDCSHCSACKH